jgi:hypothetical protein
MDASLQLNMQQSIWEHILRHLFELHVQLLPTARRSRTFQDAKSLLVHPSYSPHYFNSL